MKVLSAKGIMMAFYKRFKENHFIEPVRYKAFTQIISTREDKLFLMEEYYLDLYQKNQVCSKTRLSDGLRIEITEGLSLGDKVKVQTN